MGGTGREWQQLGEGQGHPMVKLLGVMAVAAAVLLVSQYSGLLGLSPLPDLVSGIFHGGGKEKEQQQQQQQQMTKKKKKKKNKKVRVYMDGCFDMMHYGHANALRQARGLGDELVVGVVSDEEIKANKGPPVMSMDERVVMVSSVKWVDEVITDAPYAINEEFMNKLFVEHNIDYIIHGDDPCLLPDGSDAYALAKKAGRYKQIKRTEGVSSTDIVGMVLAFLLLSLGFFHRMACDLLKFCHATRGIQFSSGIPSSQQ
jgi:ethanolamine-phosphate cytidylyltransferase